MLRILTFVRRFWVTSGQWEW